MPKKRVLVGYGVDVDAVANWLNTKDGSPVDQTNVSRGIFGATVGVDRLLKLFEKHKIKASWYVPGHTLESFPRQIEKIRDADHEIGLHGYTHEAVSALTEAQERAVLQRSIDLLTSFTGKKPKGWTCPSWTPSKSSIKLLEESGIEYDHSFMHHDCQMYYVPYPPETAVETNYRLKADEWMVPMSPALKKSKIVEVPANWHVDDWPPFQPKPALGSAGFVDPYQVERMWKEQFEYCYEEYEDGFIFPVTVHPQVSGKPAVLKMHERFIKWVSGHDGVEWCTFADMVETFKKGEIKEWIVEGGAEATTR